MPGIDELIALVRQLIAKTAAGDLRWDSTARPDIYVAPLTVGDSTLSLAVYKTQARAGSVSHYRLEVLTGLEDDADTVTIEESDVGGEDLLRELFGLASAVKKRAVASRILTALEKTAN